MEQILRPNSYTTVVKIPKKDIKKADVFICKQPRETFYSVYNRLEAKPDFMINGNLFIMSNGVTVGTTEDENKYINGGNYTDFGMAIYGDNDIRFHNYTMNNSFRDFLGGGPSLVVNGKEFLDTKGLDKSFVNSRHPRSAIGMNDEYFFMVTVDGRRWNKPGMSCWELAKLMLSLGCTQAINLDGGGSTRMARNNKGKYEILNEPTENRAVDNMLLIYLNKEESKPVPVKPPVSNVNTPIKVGDIVIFAGGPVYSSANAVYATTNRQRSQCKVTAIYNGRHKYHCISQDGKRVYGWVDESKVNKL